MRTALLSPAVVAAAIVLAGCAGSTPPQHREDEWHAPIQILQRYTDKDGGLTRVELEAGLHKDFDAADLNHNGVLEPDEVRAVNQARWQQDQSAISPLQDWNGDGVVDFAEFAATARALFREYDRNSNGVLTPDELHPGRAPQGQAGAPDQPERPRDRRGRGGGPQE